MDLSEFSFRLVLIFLPGLITYYFVTALTVHEKESTFRVLITSLLYGFLSYLFYYLITLIGGWEFHFFAVLTDTTTAINWTEIIKVSGIAIIFGLLISFAMNYKILFRFARAIRISNKIGEPGVWSQVMNMPEKVCPKWANVIDLKNNVLYYGYISIYSDSKEPEDEVFLRNVTAFQYNNHAIGARLFTTPAIYLNRKRESLIIEFPQMAFLVTSQVKAEKKNRKRQSKRSASKKRTTQKGKK